MPEDLESVVANAVAEAGIGEEAEPDIESANTETVSDEETPEVVEKTEVVDEPESAKESATDEAADDEKPVEKSTTKPAEKDQLTKDLEELGLKAPKEGERENRLPHSRVRKIAENYGKKVEARFTGVVENLTGENTRLTTRQRNFDKADELAANDPDRYMKLLSAIHPGKYDKFLSGSTAEKPTERTAEKPNAIASAAGPRPQPDVLFEDKSRGYSPEQHEKLLEWVAADAADRAETRAIEKVEAAMEAKYGKLYKSYEAQEALNEQIPHVKEVVNNVYETWGKDLVDKHEDEIVAYMEKHPTVSTADATARVLVPKLRADRNTMRGELINETKKRTAAAAKIVPGGKTVGKDDEEPESLEDVVRKSVAALRR